MRPALIISHSFLLLSAARALPLGLDAVFHIEKRHVSVATVERRHPQGLLDDLSSIGNDISSAFSPATTSSSSSSSRSTSSSSSSRSSSSERTSTSSSSSTRSSSSSSESTSTRTSSSESSTTTESSSSETSETSSATSSTSETSNTPSSTTSTPVETARSTETPEASSGGGGGGGSSASTAGIAVGAVLGAALLAGIIFVLFKWGPLAKWRENRAYERMMERTYRPALDDKGGPGMGYNNTRSAGLGLHPVGAALGAPDDGSPPNGGYRGIRPTGSAAPSPVSATVPQRAFSFQEPRSGGGSVEQERIRRKPLPTIGTGGGHQGVSPLIGGDTPTGADHAEPWLPGGAR